MAEQLLMFRGGDEKRKKLSPNEIQEHMQKWFDWVDSMRDRKIYQGGDPLEGGGKTVKPDMTVTDGPFTESKELIGGYIVIEVGSEEEAVGEAKNCPVLSIDGTVEVRTIADIDRH